MSLSVGGYHGAYAHPVAMGLSSTQDYYGASAVHHPTQANGYPDFGITDRDYFNNWVLSGTPEVAMSPEAYGTACSTPSPPSTGFGQLGYPDAIQAMTTQWQNYPMTTEELALAHNIPMSEIGHYESYTNAFGDRCLRRRTSANRKERRRTISINNAFSNLRCSIPNVPSDTKLSKIKTLKLAISYITYLNNILENDETELAQDGFKADISRKRERRTAPTTEPVKRPLDSCDSDDSSESGTSSTCESKTKGRTGWPQEVWASELRGSPQQIKTEVCIPADV